MRPFLKGFLVLLMTVGFVPQVFAQGKKPLLSDVQRKEVQETIAQFRKVRGLQEQRLAAIERMKPIGPLGLKQLLEIIQKELGKPVGDYRQALAKAAAAEGVKNLSADNLTEIAKLRTEVLALSKQPELKKEDIVKVGDPSLARLKELIIFGRDDVLKKHPELVKRREALQPLGQQWEKCAELLLFAQAEEDEKARKEKEEKEKKDGDKAAAEKTSKVKDEGQSKESGRPKEKGQPKESSPDKEKEVDETLEPPSFEKYLVKEEEMAAALAMPMDDQTRLTLAANAQVVGRLDPEEARCILDLNLTRSLLGLPALLIDAPLTAAARDHSGDMETLKFFSHESPVSGKKTPGDRAQRFGATYSAENIAVGMVDGTAVNLIWWHSPGHHKNMLGSHARVGVGRSGVYWTEVFGR